MDLKKDKWYKFDPYNNDWSTTWYLRASRDFKHGELIDRCLYIGHNKSTNYYGNTHGGFGRNYHSNICSYQEVTPKEHLWLEEISKRQKYFPIEKMKFDEVINDYNLY